MAHIKIWYRCPVCNKAWRSEREAIKCKDTHPIIYERWAVGKDGKAVKIFDNCSADGRGGENWALKEADLSDLIEVRKQQLKELRK